MHNKTRIASLNVKVLCLALWAAFPVMAEAGVAGSFQFVIGDVRVMNGAGKERVALKGQQVNEGETVLTGAGGSAQLRMIDSGMVALRPGTQLKVVTYVFNGAEDGSENAVFSLVKGGLRAITGLIGRTHKDRYKLETPTVVIGIRGTDHEPFVVPQPPAGVTATNPPGTYDRVNVGATSLTNQAGSALVARNEVGFAASPTQLPMILPTLPSFYQVTPAPLSRQNQKPAREEAQDSGSQTAAASGAGDSAASASDTAASITAAPVIEATASTTPPPTALTGNDASGTLLDVSNQTLTTADGQPLPLDGGTATPAPAPAPAPAPVPLQSTGFELIASYPATQSGNPQMLYPAVYSSGGGSLVLTRDAAGNLVGASNTSTDSFSNTFGNIDQGKSSSSSTLSQSGSVFADYGSDAATGLSWGRWQGGQVTQTNQYFGTDAGGNQGLGAVDASGVFVIGAVFTNSAVLGNGSLHWLSGSSATPGYLARVLTGSANYTLLGGTHPTDQLGTIGALNSATLGVNFTTQIANADVNFSIAGNSWDMQSNDMLLDGGHFNSQTNCTSTSCTSSVSLTKNGVLTSSVGTPTTGPSFGNLNGMLLGLGLNGAGLQYSVSDSVPTTTLDSNGNPITTFSNSLIQGVAAFAGPTQDINTPFRAVATSDGWDYDLRNSLNSGMSLDFSSFYRGSISGDIQPVARVIDSAAGLTEFLGQSRGYTPVNPLDIVPGISDRGIDSTIKIGSAVNRDVGSASIGGATISWGRWEGGHVDIYSRDGTVKLGAIDNTGRSMHWLTTSALTGSFLNLPLTGSASYTLAGSTSPTDLKGNVGTLGAVTLNADFGNAKVNAAINLGFNAPTNVSNWSMSASNIPLGGSDDFHSSSALNGVNGIVHTVSCSGVSCGPQALGYLDGHFIGGGQGAIMTYGMATGTVTATTPSTTNPATSTFTPANAVTGLVVMKH